VDKLFGFEFEYLSNMEINYEELIFSPIKEVLDMFINNAYLFAEVPQLLYLKNEIDLALYSKLETEKAKTPLFGLEITNEPVRENNIEKVLHSLEELIKQYDRRLETKLYTTDELIKILQENSNFSKVKLDSIMETAFHIHISGLSNEEKIYLLNFLNYNKNFEFLYSISGRCCKKSLNTLAKPLGFEEPILSVEEYLKNIKVKYPISNLKYNKFLIFTKSNKYPTWEIRLFASSKNTKKLKEKIDFILKLTRFSQNNNYLKKIIEENNVSKMKELITYKFYLKEIENNY
jgi:hypothetical protein